MHACACQESDVECKMQRLTSDHISCFQWSIDIDLTLAARHSVKCLLCFPIANVLFSLPSVLSTVHLITCTEFSRKWLCILLASNSSWNKKLSWFDWTDCKADIVGMLSKQAWVLFSVAKYFYSVAGPRCRDYRAGVWLKLRHNTWKALRHPLCFCGLSL